MSRKPSKLDVVPPKRKGSASTTVGIDPAFQAEFQNEAFAAAKEASARFPDLLQAVLKELRVVNPVDVVACFSIYGLQVWLGRTEAR